LKAKPCYWYAASRNILYTQGKREAYQQDKRIEILNKVPVGRSDAFVMVFYVKEDIYTTKENLLC
jgi:hypothetical protein